MNYSNATSNTTNIEPALAMTKREPINEMLCEAKDEGLNALVLLAKLHNFLFAEEKPTDPPQPNIKCMCDCVETIRDKNAAIQRMLSEICERLGM